MIIHPEDIQPVARAGYGNMGDVTDITSEGRFLLEDIQPGGGYVLAGFKIRVFGSAGSAPLYLKVDHRWGSDHDYTLQTWVDFGVGAEVEDTDIHFRLDNDELRDWTFRRDPVSQVIDVLVLEWTNPDSPDMKWAAIADLVNLVNVQRT